MKKIFNLRIGIPIITVSMLYLFALKNTLTYTSNYEETINVFTTGNVDVVLNESRYPGNSDPSVQAIIPNQIIEKNPNVKNVGSEPAVVFLVADMPMGNVTIVDNKGETIQAKSNKEIFNVIKENDGKNPGNINFDDVSWTKITEGINSEGSYTRYVFGYNTILNPNEETNTLFDKVIFKNIIQDEIDGQKKNICVKACAIQSEQLLGITEEFNPDSISKEALTQIWNIYSNQKPIEENKLNTYINVAKMKDVFPYKITAIKRFTNADQINYQNNAYRNSINNIDNTTEKEITSTQIEEDPFYQRRTMPIASSFDNPILVSTSESESDVYMWADGTTLYWKSDAKNPKLSGDTSSLFHNESYLTDLSGMADFDLSNITNVQTMFANCTSLTSLNGLEEWNVSNITNFTDMFNGCSKLSDISALRKWNTENALSFERMFKDCTVLNSLNGLENWNTNKVNDINAMFQNTSISDLTLLQNWNTMNVTNMHRMFSGCSNLTDASIISSKPVIGSEGILYESWNLKNATDLIKIFADCNNLSKLPTWSIDGHWILPDGSYVLYNSIIDNNQFESVATPDITAIKHYTKEQFPSITVPAALTTVSKPTSNEPVYMWKDGTVAYWMSNSKHPKLEGDCGRLLGESTRKYTKLTDITGLADFNTKDVTHFDTMFYGALALEDISPLSRWNTSNGIDFHNMFYGCQNLKDISPLVNWDMSNATDLSRIFRDCRSLLSLEPLKFWNTKNVTNMEYMFRDCRSLTSLKGIETWDVSKVTTLYKTFRDCRSLKSIAELKEWNVSNVSNMSETFYHCDVLASIGYLSKWNTQSVTTLDNTFASCPLITQATSISSKFVTKHNGDKYEAWNVDKCTSFTNMFNNIPKLPKKELPKFTRPGQWDKNGSFIPTI